jgi:branched-chain amino acid transport system permease protein
LPRWESVTNGNDGMRIKQIELFGFTVSRDSSASTLPRFPHPVVLVLALNLLRSPTGAPSSPSATDSAAQSIGSISRSTR